MLLDEIVVGQYMLILANVYVPANSYIVQDSQKAHDTWSCIAAFHVYHGSWDTLSNAWEFQHYQAWAKEQ